MEAAAVGADETVALLLSKGADPDLMNSYYHTALTCAIYSQCSSTVALLAPVTKKGLEGVAFEGALATLALWQTGPKTKGP